MRKKSIYEPRLLNDTTIHQIKPAEMNIGHFTSMMQRTINQKVQQKMNRVKEDLKD